MSDVVRRNDEPSSVVSTRSEEMNIGYSRTIVRRVSHVSVSSSRVTGSDTEYVTGSVTDDDETYYGDYTSGYDARTHGDSTADTRAHDGSFVFESPQSDELSSTAGSILLDNEVVRKVQETFFFLRKPIAFLACVLPGSNFFGVFCRSVHAVTATSQRFLFKAYGIMDDTYFIPNRFVCTTPWLERARASLPSLVERFVKRALALAGVPSIADLQRRKWAEVMDSLKYASEDVASQVNFVTSEPMVPLAVFLPLFSLTTIAIARHIVLQRLDDIREGVTTDVSLGGRGTLKSSASSPSVDGQHLSAVSDKSYELYIKRMQERREEVQSTTGGIAPVPSLVMSAGLPKDDRSISTHQSTLDTSVALGVESSVSSTHDDMLKLTLSPSSEVSELSPYKPLPVAVHEIGSHILGGEVVVALVGTPSQMEISVLLSAAVAYNCQKVILPASIPELNLASVPSSLTVVQVKDVMEHIVNVEEARGLNTVGVYLYPVTPDAIELTHFTHPKSVIYIFVPETERSGNVLAHFVDQCVYLSSSDEPIPAHLCLYDRSTKITNST
uniref:Uncharacterized protein n=1 Tax=Trypanosoma vivax (strain Y486) TaxID=1055687 RepID=G0TXT7_TRYVY|nr:conserved hypothetical protein [Trypanosoma vivax Y486]